MSQEGNAPQVSILIPTYNSAPFLDEAIQSALNQTFTNFELIIVDNASTDDTYSVIAPYLSDNRVQYYKNAVNIGMVNNWNLALSYARGKYIKFLCSDDKFHPQLLEKFVPILDQYPQVSLITSDREIFGAKSYTWQSPLHYLQNGHKIITHNLKVHNFLGEPTAVMFRKADLKVGLFNSYYKYLIDWDMWLRLLTVGDCYIVPETLSFFRIHANQATSTALKSFTNYFEEYYLYKSIQLDNNLEKFLSAAELDKMIKIRAMYCFKALIKIVMSFEVKKNWPIINEVIKIQQTERVPINYYLSLFSKRPLLGTIK